MESKMEYINPFPVIRWTATIYVRTSTGIVTSEHQVDDFSDLQDIVSSGSNKYSIDRIEIRHNDDCGDTIEELDLIPAVPMAYLQAARRHAKRLRAKLAREYGLRR
jgi:hypothetical protein